MTHLAEVRLWGKQVGALAYEAQSHLSTFEYAPSWRHSGVEIAPLHMPLAATKYRFPGLDEATFRGLPAVFADALPDDFGNAVIDAWLASVGRNAEDFTPVERLLYTGSRGMGALEFYPAFEQREKYVDDIQLDSLVALAQQVLDRRNASGFSFDDKGDALQQIVHVGTSAGGARAKALIAIDKERKNIRSGQVDAPEGFEHYLLKLDGIEEHKTQSETYGDPQGFGRMEYAYYLMAKDAGLRMSHSELLLEGARAHFMTQRFDREGNRKKHYVSLCAMDHASFKKPGAYSYEQLFTVARKLRLPREDAIEIFKRMVFNVVARNHDDHTKNTGFILDGPQAPWRLAPAFDVAYSYKPDSPWVSQHQMSLNGKRDHFTREDLLTVAKQINNFREAPGIIDRIVAVVHEWSHYAEQADVAEPLATLIKGHLRVV